MSFRSVFLAIVIGFALIVAAFLINRQRPKVETDQPEAALVRASGKCAECHTQQQYSVVHEYEMSRHAQKGVSCLDCHQPADNQQRQDHHGFVITKQMTAGNCRSCHEGTYQEFVRSRHAAVSWAAVYGEQGLSAEQVAFAEKYQPGYAKRPPHPFVKLEGTSAMTSGCAQCHSVGRPNEDGTIGTCTACHTRHTSSVEIARLPRTCTQCHTSTLINRVYDQAEQVVTSTNEKVQNALNIVNGLKQEGALAGEPFSHPIDFIYFDLWHYDGRTSKHGAFMGGADFVQWHGNYPMLYKTVELKSMADELRRGHGKANPVGGPPPAAK
ncbi:MAG TPA: ammonia-forming cytochrome c nitrite reductase subunit c552 [Blastocatellia bacterium]|nr:ammonia-forming cytochrome c nitrite reductase subunit c552 [Blastocatellia bacterium]